MSDVLKELEQKLASYFGRKYCIVTGSGSTALFMAFSLIKKSRPKVLLPATICYQPVLAAYFAKKIPKFVDVLESNATINPKLVLKVLKEDKQIGAVVAAHMYGFLADMEELIKICMNQNVYLVEDAAQAMGGCFKNGNKVGSSGDCSIVSFGHTKILDAGGGGVFLTNDKGIAKRARIIHDSLKCRNDNYHLNYEIYSKLYYLIWEYAKTDRKFYKLYDQFPELFCDLFIYKASKKDIIRIGNSLKFFNSEIKHRKEIYALYESELQNVDGLKFFNGTKDSELFVPWRFSFRMNSKYRDSLLKKIRSYGFDISSWYPNVNNWSSSGRRQNNNEFPIANNLENEVVNLWVTRDYTKKRVHELIKLIKKFMRSHNLN